MPDYAPLLSMRERKRIALLPPLALIAHYWLRPGIEAYARRAKCYDYGGFNGAQVLLHGLFAGGPLAMAMLLLPPPGRRRARIVRLRQASLPGEKVLRNTRYRYGRAALLQPILVVLTIAL